MKFLSKSKDGGPLSTVTAYWLVEIKSLLSIALLRFDDGSRDEYHSHAFHSASWLLDGLLREEHLTPPGDSTTKRVVHHKPGLRPILTFKKTFHRVFSSGTTWVLTFRGPWAKTWQEYSPKSGTYKTLKHGRIEVGQ